MRMKISGARNGAPWPAPGGVVDLPTAEAQKLVSAGMAVPARVETSAVPAAEVSAPPEPETATPPAPKRRGRPKLPRDAQGNIIRK
jgi:hypothetical protein